MLVNTAVPAGELPPARWRKSRASNPTGSCVELAELPDGAIAVRNSRDKQGLALIYSRVAIATFLAAMKDGEFDALMADLTRAQPAINKKPPAGPDTVPAR